MVELRWCCLCSKSSTFWNLFFHGFSVSQVSFPFGKQKITFQGVKKIRWVYKCMGKTRKANTHNMEIFPVQSEQNTSVILSSKYKKTCPANAPKQPVFFCIIFGTHIPIHQPWKPMYIATTVSIKKTRPFEKLRWNNKKYCPENLHRPLKNTCF